MNTSLVIMAAGIGSRFGEGIKQLTPIGPNGEIIMDYSIHDAIAAGFNKIVFIIRRDIESDFRDAIGSRVERECARLGVEVAYVYQGLQDIPAGFTVPDGRKKPWGTAHAVLCCKDVIHEPFGVINADDYYGRQGYVQLHDFLCRLTPDTYNHYCMVAFWLGNTLSENGGVSRGVCQVSGDNRLLSVTETFEIAQQGDHVTSNTGELSLDTPVSMNMWGLTPAFMGYLQGIFPDFLANLGDNPLKAELLLPNCVSGQLEAGQADVTVLHTPDKWFGVTYKEDKAAVIDAMKQLVTQGVYQSALYSDL